MHTTSRTTIELCAILLAGLFIYTWRLGAAPIDGTEPLRALVGHQMAQGGSLLVPRIYGEVYLRKPPLMYWIIAATEKALGYGDEFVWRLPSALGAVALAIFLAWWAGRWFGDAARLVSGFACLGLIALWAQDRGADIDSLDTLTSVLAACCILELGFGPARQRWLWVVALAAAAGAALLLKGPAAAPTIAGALVASALLPAGRRNLKKPGVWFGLLAGVAIFAVWLLEIYLAIKSQRLTVDTSGAGSRRANRAAFVG